eukprot:5163210-Prymnesium_polylepis.1
MASEALWSAGAGKVGEGCSGAGSKARVAWRCSDDRSPCHSPVAGRRSSRLLAQCVYQRRRCRAGGRRPADEH